MLFFPNSRGVQAADVWALEDPWLRSCIGSRLVCSAVAPGEDHLGVLHSATPALPLRVIPTLLRLYEFGVVLYQLSAIDFSLSCWFYAVLHFMIPFSVIWLYLFLCFCGFILYLSLSTFSARQPGDSWLAFLILLGGPSWLTSTGSRTWARGSTAGAHLTPELVDQVRSGWGSSCDLPLASQCGALEVEEGRHPSGTSRGSSLEWEKRRRRFILLFFLLLTGIKV